MDKDCLFFYRKKKVFITGHTGFKGSWLMVLLNYLGADIAGYSLDSNGEESLFNEIKNSISCDTKYGDIRNAEYFDKVFNEVQPDIVFHLAAQPLVRDSYFNPRYTFETNFNGTLNLLESLRNFSKPCNVVIITTDKVYESREWVYPYREIDRLGGNDPYSSSKACVEGLVNSYVTSFFSPQRYQEHKKIITVARAGNVIGGGDWSSDRIIPDFFRALQEGKKLYVRNPASIRPWQHVIEPLYGYLLLAYKADTDPLSFVGPWNFGPYSNESISVKELIEFCISVIGKGSMESGNGKSGFHETNILRLDITKAEKRLLWKPKWSTKTAISRTVNWYNDVYFNKQSAFDLMLMDIKDYLESEF